MSARVFDFNSIWWKKSNYWGTKCRQLVALGGGCLIPNQQAQALKSKGAGKE